MYKEFFKLPSLIAPPEAMREIEIAPRTLILMVGLPGSGKSTFARKHFPLDAIVSTDEIRRELSNYPSNQLVSDQAFMIGSRIVRERLSRDGIVVFDAQNLTENNRKTFYQIAKEQGACIEVFFMDVGPEESIVRDAKRAQPVEADYIKARASAFAMAEKSLLRSHFVDRMHRVDAETIDGFAIRLPKQAEKDLESDREMEAASATAQAAIHACEAGLLQESAAEEPPLSVEAGSVLFLPESSQRAAFLRNNFLPHQTIDLCALAERLQTHVEDVAVGDVATLILKQRIFFNLTTVLAYPEESALVGRLRREIRFLEEK